MLSPGKSIGCITALVILTFAFFVGAFIVFMALSIVELPWGQETAWQWMGIAATEPPYEVEVWIPNTSGEGEGGEVSGLPADGPVSATFHDPNYLAHFGSEHQGVDIAVPAGTEVRATMGGKVVIAGWQDGGYGNTVVIASGNEQIILAHNSEVLVSTGETVAKGQVIALSGNTGKSTGAHIHYEVRKDGVPVDPLAYP